MRKVALFYATDFINNSYYILFSVFVNPFIMISLKKCKKRPQSMHSFALGRLLPRCGMIVGQGPEQEEINLECAVNLVFHFPEHEDIIDYVATMMN